MTDTTTIFDLIVSLLGFSWVQDLINLLLAAFGGTA